jgi:hypothetical protein
MKLTLKEADDILQKEIVWCLEHPDKDLTMDQQLGFMNGLRAAQIILRKAENILAEDHNATRYYLHTINTKG